MSAYVLWQILAFQNLILYLKITDGLTNPRFMRCFLYLIIYTLATVSFGESLKAQKAIGISGGIGSEDVFPFNNANYTLDTRFVKAAWIYGLPAKRKMQYEILIEPSYYRTSHQLLNPEFVQSDYGPDYLEQREEYQTYKRFDEFAINLGIQFVYPVSQVFNAVLLISVGPNIQTKRTERLPKGFAFSDIGALGFQYRYENVILESKLSVRHVSNASLRSPNGGHNSSNVEFGIRWLLGRKVKTHEVNP